MDTQSAMDLAPGFERALALVLELEGPPSNDPDDPGGETVLGLSRRAHPDLTPWPPSLEQARAAYRAHYWNAVRADELPAPLALVAFDTAVNQGVQAAIRRMQEGLGVRVDGVLGPATLAAAWRAGWRGHVAMTAARLDAYDRIVQANQRSEKYLDGWRNRALYALRAAVLLEAR